MCNHRRSTRGAPSEPLSAEQLIKPSVAPAAAATVLATAQAAWQRLLRKLRRIRKQQRIWAYLGHRLQEYPATFRNDLSRLLPNRR